MKICFLANDLNSGAGGGRYTSELIDGVKKGGHHVVVLTETGDAPNSILRRGFGVFSSSFKARQFLKDCDIIHALDGYPYAIIASLAGVRSHKKIVITAIGTYSVAPLYNRSSGLLLKFAYKRADKIIAISNYTKNEILKKVNLKNIEVINPGIDFNKLYAPRMVTGGKFILSVGALKHRKGYHISIPAFAEAKKTIPDLTYKIVGDQSNIGYFRHLQELAKKFNIENDIQFIQKISDEELRRLYQKASLFVLASVNEGHHFEGFGLVFCEAAAAGLPVVGTRGNGIEDAVRDGYNGILVPQNDIQGTVDAIISILSDSTKFAKMSHESYEWAKQHDLSGVIPKYLDVYEALL